MVTSVATRSLLRQCLQLLCGGKQHVASPRRPFDMALLGSPSMEMEKRGLTPSPSCEHLGLRGSLPGSSSKDNLLGLFAPPGVPPAPAGPGGAAATYSPSSENGRKLASFGRLLGRTKGSAMPARQSASSDEKPAKDARASAAHTYHASSDDGWLAALAAKISVPSRGLNPEERRRVALLLALPSDSSDCQVPSHRRIPRARRSCSEPSLIATPRRLASGARRMRPAQQQKRETTRLTYLPPLSLARPTRGAAADRLAARARAGDRAARARPGARPPRAG